MEFWIAQIIAVVICILSAYSYFKKSKDGFLFLQVLVNVLYCVQYALLGVWSGAVANVITAVKFISFRKDAIDGVKTPLKKTIIFCIASVVFGLLVFDGPLSLIPIITAVLITFATAQDNPVIIRAAYTVANLMWIFFNFMSRAYVSAIYSAFELIVSFIAVLIFMKKAKENDEKDAPPEGEK